MEPRNQTLCWELRVLTTGPPGQSLHASWFHPLLCGPMATTWVQATVFSSLNYCLGFLSFIPPVFLHITVGVGNALLLCHCQEPRRRGVTCYCRISRPQQTTPNFFQLLGCAVLSLWGFPFLSCLNRPSLSWPSDLGLMSFSLQALLFLPRPVCVSVWHTPGTVCTARISTDYRTVALVHCEADMTTSSFTTAGHVADAVNPLHEWINL